ncbi:MAG TPA: hypothetical protein VNA69_00550 [Thermoanaerobaculia bacterium]|nr:hypothetical protein [Thermoanaerobaculia bacterium]
MVWLRLRSFDADATLTTAEVAVTAASATDTPPSRETYYVIDDPGPGVPATSSQQARAREKRYEELLRAAPPGEPQPQQGEATSRITSATPAQQTPPPTLLQRVVKPIADALGRKRQAPQTPPQMQPSRNASAAPQKTTSSGNPEPQAEKNPLTDEDSDVAPPRLLSLDFTPPVVQDGEQTIFAAMVMDDLSGVQSVSGVIVSPSGAQQGFACQREGDTGRYIARITVPREAASGTWSIRYLTLTDNARNTISLNPQQGTLPGNANFRVMSSASDSIGPVLKAVWLEQPSMSAGQKNNVMVQTDDDKSGVGLVSGVFLSPSRQARIGFACRNTGGDMWQCPISPPACGDCGVWQLEQVQMQDKANNMTTARGDNAHVGPVKLQLMGDACDSTAPVLTSLSLAPPVVSNKETSVVIVTAMATDNQCGVASLSGQAFAPAGISSRIPFSFRATGDGQTFIGEIKVDVHTPSGIWTIGWMQALDKGHNMRTYTASDPAIANVTFRVE